MLAWLTWIKLKGGNRNPWESLAEFGDTRVAKSSMTLECRISRGKETRKPS